MSSVEHISIQMEKTEFGESKGPALNDFDAPCRLFQSAGQGFNNSPAGTDHFPCRYLDVLKVERICAGRGLRGYEACCLHSKG